MSEQKLRLFVAVDVPVRLRQGVMDSIDDVVNKMPSARWVPVENQHVTLKFLGYTPGSSFDDIGVAVAAVASRHTPAQLRLAQPGAFPSTRRARVLWVGLRDDADLLASLAASLDEALAPLGFEPEKRAFTPHLTIARLKSPARLPDLPRLGLDEAFEIDAIHLYRSHLHPKGARYEVMKTFPLGSEVRVRG